MSEAGTSRVVELDSSVPHAAHQRGLLPFLAARFQYPEVLDGRAQDVLPALLATGADGRTAWAIYSVLPLVFIPAGVGAFEALRDRAQGPMRVGLLFAVLAAVSRMLGLGMGQHVTDTNSRG